MMNRTCRNCRYYNKSSATCCYYRAEVPVILDDSCLVWSEKE
jgi:hypothetical protein